MSFGRNASRKREAARQHLRTVHTCKCGREIRGNAYYTHKYKCATWQIAQRGGAK